MKPISRISLLLVLITIVSSPARAAEPSGVMVTQTRRCQTTGVNLQGTGGAGNAITIDNTSGGVSIMLANSQRCGGTIQNTGAAAMNCAPTTETVSATIGFTIAAGASYNFGPEGAQAWKCIRTTSSSTTANVAEALP
jgi:hypothetical protein